MTKKKKHLEVFIFMVLIYGDCQDNFTDHIFKLDLHQGCVASSRTRYTWFVEFLRFVQ